MHSIFISTSKIKDVNHAESISTLMLVSNVDQNTVNLAPTDTRGIGDNACSTNDVEPCLVPYLGGGNEVISPLVSAGSVEDQTSHGDRGVSLCPLINSSHIDFGPWSFNRLQDLNFVYICKCGFFSKGEA